VAHITLSEEQLRILASSSAPVEIRDASGTIRGYASPLWTEEDFAEAQRILAADGPWHTTEQVVEHLRSLKRP
jgi:hypothetical protein